MRAPQLHIHIEGTWVADRTVTYKPADSNIERKSLQKFMKAVVSFGTQFDLLSSVVSSIKRFSSKRLAL